MSVTVRIGPRTAFVGSAVGSGADDEGGSSVLPGVTRDATSLKYVPASTSEWATVMAAAGLSTGPSLLWGMQDASGNLADPIGGFTGTLVGGTATYQQTVPGWSRVGVRSVDGGTTNFNNTTAGLPDGATTSQLTLCYLHVTAGTSRGLLFQHTPVTGCLMRTSGTSTPQFFLFNSGATTNGANTLLTSTPTVLVVKNDRTASVQRAYSESEKLSIAFNAAVAGKQIGIGAPGLNTAACTYIYMVSFFGSAAELTDAQIKTLLQTLGWAPSWT